MCGCVRSDVGGGGLCLVVVLAVVGVVVAVAAVYKVVLAVRAVVLAVVLVLVLSGGVGGRTKMHRLVAASSGGVC